MEVVSDWKRLDATIRVNAYAVEEMDDATLEECVVHELCHVLVSEMRVPYWADAPAAIMQAQFDHEERVVTMLTKAFGWTFQAGAGELEDEVRDREQQPLEDDQMAKTLPVEIKVSQIEEWAAILAALSDLRDKVERDGVVYVADAEYQNLIDALSSLTEIEG